MTSTSTGFASAFSPALTPPLLPGLLRALEEKGYTAPTPIQLAAIPAIFQGRDVLGSAQTGSGKTAAFALPMLQSLADAPLTKTRIVRGLVLVPTRELAAQVGASLLALGKYMPQRRSAGPPQASRAPSGGSAVHEVTSVGAQALKVTVVFGGVSINPQMMGLRSGADVIVATPGRLIDLIEHKAVKLGEVEMLVLDEADRLLDLGFGEELARILALLPAKRQTLFFSATFPPAIEALASSMLREPLRVEINSEPEGEPDITQRAIAVDAPRRTQLLRHLIQTEKWSRVLVFVATKHAAEIVADKLRKVKINAEPFHGELSQGKRTQVLMDFKAKAVQVVVATDVAARGIDIKHLPVVVNYDLPRSATDYTHRIGRTGRAGESGIAISFVSAATVAHFKLIEKRHAVKMVLEQVAGFEPVEAAPVNAADPQGTGGVKGKRPSKKDKLRAAQHQDTAK